MSTGKTPIALFVYNRAHYTESVLNSLSRCARLDECRLFIFSDGPKTPEDAEKVTAARQVSRAQGLKMKAELIERDQNLGLAHSVVTGVSELCQNYGRVIVLEDDLFVSPFFLDYMLQALDRYQDNEQVTQISGFMHPVVHPKGPDAYLMPYTTSWGWATWDRAWRLFSWDAQSAYTRLSQNPGLRSQFNLDDGYPYMKILENCVQGRNDSWAIRWWWVNFQAGNLTLHPRNSLVWVGGFDGSGTHIARNANYWQSSLKYVQARSYAKGFKFPDSVSVDQAAFSRVKDHLRSRFGPQTLWIRIKRRMNRLIWPLVEVKT